MIEHYLRAVSHALSDVLDVVVKLALPLAIALSCALLAGAFLAAQHKDALRPHWKRYAAQCAGYLVLALLTVIGWAALKMTQPLARMDMKWREAAEATTDSVPDAPPVIQTGPALASLDERTYTRTLTLPPDFMRRLGGEGAGILAPYLTDPSSDNVLRLKDTFRRSGRDAVFTRQATQREEVPMPFADSHVKVQFQRLPGRAYDATFEGRYLIRNATARPIVAQFLFNLPEAGTVRDLKVTVGTKAVTDPDDEGAYRWTDKLGAGESREAIVNYRVIGARAWQYGLGSSRRRVQHFQLDAATDGIARFGRASLQPTTMSGSNFGWKLENVVTAQQIALIFPPNTWEKQGYLQALSALPASFILFLVGAIAIGARERRIGSPSQLAAALALFGFGLGATTVLSIYLPVTVATIAAPLSGAFLAIAAVGRRYWLAALPTALIPATFLSPENSGLLIVMLTLFTLGSALLAERWHAKPAV
jgi:hypothetical protein